MPTDLPPRARVIADMCETVIAAAAVAARSTIKSHRASRPKQSYTVLQPGPSTPLWNELAAMCAAELRRYGDKARLARILGVPRQRVHMLLVAKSACPDAERTLLLLAWLHARRRGADLA